MNVKIIPALVLLMFIPQAVLASGIQVSPAKLDFQITPGQPQPRQLVVANPTADVQTFQIYAQDYPSAITAEPNDFALEAGGRKEVAIYVDGKNLPVKVNSQLAIVARPLANSKNLSVATGVKVPLTITNEKQTKAPIKTNPIIILALLLLAISLALSLRHLKKHPGYHNNS